MSAKKFLAMERKMKLSKPFLLTVILSVFISCDQGEEGLIKALVVETGNLQNITPNSAEVIGRIEVLGSNIGEGELDVMARGAVWSSIFSEPTIEKKEGITSDGSGLGNFKSNLTGLTELKKYYVRSYGISKYGVYYGKVKVLYATDKPFDFDGNIYETVVIGNQEWMDENLRTTHYSDGNPLVRVDSEFNWLELKKTDKAYCYYDNDPSNGDIYGLLYTWSAAVNYSENSENDFEKIQGACPFGWHIPSDVEWNDLERHLGISDTELDIKGWHGSDEGSMLKELGTEHWQSPNYATNETGFNALPGGFRNISGQFNALGELGYWHSSTEYENDYTYDRFLQHDEKRIFRSIAYWANAGSVRCVKD